MKHAEQTTLLQKLHEKYAYLFDGKNLIIPDRLRIQKLQNDDFYREVLNLYSTDPIKLIEDQEILDLIQFHNPKLGYAIRILKDSQYRSLEDHHKFPISCFLDPDCTLYHHGERFSGMSESELIFSKGLILNNHKYKACPFDEGFKYNVYYE
jgi:hypothetical protein